jgi:hypothetical protein
VVKIDVELQAKNNVKEKTDLGVQCLAVRQKANTSMP